MRTASAGIRGQPRTIFPYSPGIDGPEVASRTTIPSGATLTVISVYESNRLFDPSLRVRLGGVPLPEDLPVRLDLMRGNQRTARLSLNQCFKETEESFVWSAKGSRRPISSSGCVFGCSALVGK